MKSEAFHFEISSLTDPGRVRLLNEDAVMVDGACGFAVVADGMGGIALAMSPVVWRLIP
jgi:hypothetical protein